MYLVAIKIRTPGWQVALGILHRALGDGATVADGLEHVHLLVDEDGHVVFCLYLRASSPEEAAAHAEQLCRRTMAALSPASKEWAVLSTRTMPGTG
ncbi:hypothetical protein [Sphaerisporangium sp. NPDC051011]|uniref:hypothetical protein n=1 Tax=Sphaerisporangium sp. NPDC051011 TaxID=3155792 RepID=UPI0033C998BA